MGKWCNDIDKNTIFEISRNVLMENSRHTPKEYSIDILNKQFLQYVDVFPADKFADTEFFTEHLNIRKGDDFLEIGVGSGITSVIAASKGANVTGIDINPNAVKNAKANANLHKVENNTNFIVSDLFENMGDKTFDVIYWNVPFCFVEVDNLSVLEKSVFDYHYNSIHKFINEAGKFLKTDGILYIGFSNTIGSPDKLFNYLFEANFKSISIVAQKNIDWNEITFDLTLFKIKNQ
jgi:release factor glutamine methyltransferase